MADNAARADEFRKQAEKKMKALGWFGGGSKWEDAAELWEKAANNYKLAKCWKEASEAYEKLAECHMKIDSKHEAAGCYVDAAKAASKVDPKRSKALLQLAVGLYTDMGRLNMAARQLKQIAEELEKSGAKEESITYYEQAADLFETENSDSEATKCKLKIAEFTAEAGKYSKAVELYEAAARRAVDNNLLKFSARGYLLNAGVCLFCYASLDEIERRIDKYKDIDLQFSGSREAMLMEQLLDAFRNENETEFATALADFDSVIRLDAWKTKILLVAKRRLGDISLGVKGAAGDEEDEDDDVL